MSQQNALPVYAQPVAKTRHGRQAVSDDLLTVEEPLEIRLNYWDGGQPRQQSISVTMRTPGHDFELALGFLYTEGVIKTYQEVASVQYCATAQAESVGNIVKVGLHPGATFDPRLLNRNFFMTASCGICGKGSIETVAAKIPDHGPPRPASPALLGRMHAMAETLREKQVVFKHTGSIHAAGLFDFSGRFVMMYEDVGRHNAVDKLVGAALAKGLLPLRDYCIMVSGRAGFELVQKSLMAGLPAMGAVGAPSSLAAQLAAQHQMALVGFVKATGYNVYSGATGQSETPQNTLT